MASNVCVSDTKARKKQYGLIADRYVVTGRLGEGGNGIVLKGFERHSMKKVAIKVAIEPGASEALWLEYDFLKYVEALNGSEGALSPVAMFSGHLEKSVAADLFTLLKRTEDLSRASVPAKSLSHDSDERRIRSTQQQLASHGVAASCPARQAQLKTSTLEAGKPLCEAPRDVLVQGDVFLTLNERLEVAGSQVPLVDSQDLQAFVTAHGKERNPKVQALVVMERLGRSLDAFSRGGVHGCNFVAMKLFTPGINYKTFLDLCRSMLTAVQALHGRGVLHGDIKLSNFVLSKRSPNAVTSVSIIDYGFAAWSISFQDARHRYSRFRGTPDFASRNMLLRVPLCYGDDLECLAYCFLELYLGDLPWRYRGASSLQYTRSVQHTTPAQGGDDHSYVEPDTAFLLERREIYKQYRKAGFVPDFVQRLISRARMEQADAAAAFVDMRKSPELRRPLSLPDAVYQDTMTDLLAAEQAWSRAGGPPRLCLPARPASSATASPAPKPALTATHASQRASSCHERTKATAGSNAPAPQMPRVVDMDQLDTEACSVAFMEAAQGPRGAKKKRAHPATEVTVDPTSYKKCKHSVWARAES